MSLTSPPAPPHSALHTTAKKKKVFMSLYSCHVFLSQNILVFDVWGLEHTEFYKLWSWLSLLPHLLSSSSLHASHSGLLSVLQTCQARLSPTPRPSYLSFPLRTLSQIFAWLASLLKSWLKCHLFLITVYIIALLLLCHHSVCRTLLFAIILWHLSQPSSSSLFVCFH